MPSLLIVDDEPEILETTKWAFEMAGYQVHTAASAEEALPQAQSFRPEVLLIDYKLPLMNGLEFLGKVRDWLPNSVAIMITGLTHQTESVEKECEELGTYAFLHKPLRMEEVLQVVKNALQSKTAA